LFSLYRYHAVFSDSPLTLVQAEKAHRDHAILEQVHADLKNGSLAHLPSGSFQANSAWLVLAAIAFNLTRAAGCLAAAFHARATTSTIRAQLINVPGPARPLRPQAPNAPPDQLALGTSLDTTVRRDPRTTHRSLNPPTAARPNRDPKWKSRTDRPVTHARSPTKIIKRRQGRSRIGAVDPGLAVRVLSLPRFGELVVSQHPEADR